MQLALARKDELFNGGIIASSSFYTGSFRGCNYFRTWFSTWRRWHIQYVCAPRRSSGRAQSHKVKSTGDISLFFPSLSFLPDYSECESKIQPAAGLITGDVGVKLPSSRAQRDWSAGFGCVTPRREATVSSRPPPPVQRHSVALYKNGNDKSSKHYVWKEDEKQSKSAASHSVYPSVSLLLITLVGFKSLLCVKNLQGCWQTPSSSSATHPNPPTHPSTSNLLSIFISPSNFCYCC